MIWIIALFTFFVITSVVDQEQIQRNVAYEQQEEISDELFGEVLREVERQNNWEPAQAERVPEGFFPKQSTTMF